VSHGTGPSHSLGAGHIYVVASGYGKRVVPASVPFELARSDDDTLIATVTAGEAPRMRRIATDSPVDRGDTPDPVADILDGPARNEWWLETSVYSVPLPSGWAAIATGEVSPAFQLVREPDGSIFLQTARNRPAVDELAAPGQTLVARGDDEDADWVELSYTHDGRLWRQRHSLLRTRAVAMITAQSPADDFAEIRETQQELTRRVLFAP
jgi:hypothetical protein